MSLLTRRRKDADEFALDPADEADEQPRRRLSLARRIIRGVGKVALGYYAFCVVLLVIYRFVWPPVTGVQLQRRAEAMAAGREYHLDRA